MDYLILILFITEVLTLSMLDRILYGTFLTPTIILSVPYLLIVLIAILLGPSIGFLPFYYPSLWVWIIGLPIFWLPGLILATGILNKTHIYNYPYGENINSQLDKIIHRLSYVFIFILTFELIRISRSAAIGSDAFEAAFGGGISGHSLLISRFLFICLIVRFKKAYILSICILLLFFILYGVKGWIFIPILSGILIRILLKKTKFSLFLVSKILIIGLVVFYIVYRIAIGPSMLFSFVFSHFMTYLFSGVLGLSEYIRLHGETGIDPPTIINPLINIYNHFLGGGELYQYKDILTYIGVDSYTNTKTFFGTVYIYSGALWGILFSFIIGLLSYSFLILSIKTKNTICLVIYGTFLTMFFFGWFDSYTGNLFFYEFPTFGLLFFFIFTFLKRVSFHSMRDFTI